MESRKRYKALMGDKDVNRWYENLARGSLSTADVQFRALGRFCERFGVTPKGLLQLSKRDRLGMLMDYVTGLDKEGKAGSYIESCIKPVKSWLRYNGKPVNERIKVRGARIPKTLKDERVPSQEELKKIYLAATKVSRVCCALMSQSGVRPEVLGNYKGTDGLRLGDFPELEIREGKVRFLKMPAKIVVRPELSKAGHEYFTFIGPEGAGYIADLLTERTKGGEKLDRNSPLIVPRNNPVHFITTINVGDQVRAAIRGSGIVFEGRPWRPYVLRAYFATQMMQAESKGLILRDYRVFFMGHKGDVEHTYTLNKALGEDKVEAMRSAYEKALKFLQTDKKGIPEEDLKRMLRENALMIMENAFGISIDEKRKEEMYDLSIEDFQEELRKISREKKADILNNGNHQKVIPLKDVESFVEKGWDFVSSLPGEKAIIKLPDKF